MLTRHTRLRLAREARMDAEGSRGGKVIGHTSSGKPIYAEKIENTTADHQEHSHWSAKDHYEAMKLHEKHEKEHKEAGRNSQAKKHASAADFHGEAFAKKK